MMNKPTFDSTKPKVNTGELRIPITFFKMNNLDSPEPTDISKNEVFSCLCQAYSPSNKDKVTLDSHSVSRGVTVLIPDTQGEFIPTYKMTAVISDVRYQNIEWNIIEIRHDFENSAFVTLVLGMIE